MHYILFYDELVPDYAECRTPFRPQHLKLVQAAYDRGEIVLAGALGEPLDKAVLVSRRQQAAEDFARHDPYVANGLVKKWHVRQWFTVVGDGATMP